MNKIEAMRALCDGKKVRQVDWPQGYFVAMTTLGWITNNNGGSTNLNQYFFSDWELYEEPKPKATYDDAVAAREVLIYWPSQSNEPGGELLIIGSGWDPITLAKFDLADRRGYRMAVVERC